MGSISPDTGASNIIDIRTDAAGIELKQLILDGLQPKNGEPKTLPTLLLYDSTGLKLFEKITYLDEYYLTGDEIEVLEDHAAQIAERIPDHSMVVELGSGNLRKVKVLLDALEVAKKHVSYFALDLMRSELERTLAAVPKGTFEYVQCFGLHGTYDDGLEWLQRSENTGRPKVVLSLGSSIGNFTRDEAAGFVNQFADILSPDDRLLIGVDSCQEPEKVYHAYSDSEGVTEQFTLNGLQHANELLGHEAFCVPDWDFLGHYDERDGCNQAFVVPKKDMILRLSDAVQVDVHAGEKIRIEESYKYNPAQAQDLWRASNVIEGASWTNHAGSYRLHMLNRPPAMFSTAPEEYAAHPVPSLEEWNALWKVWDTVTRQMIPDEELKEKPIKLRNACIFYLGHIPTFLDMKIVEGTKLQPTDPAYYTQIFERGIDPDVDNPEQVHAHSEVPDEWPPLNEILDYQARIRQRVTSLYKSGQAYDDAWTGRVMWLGFEHEAMHLETLLYMLLQSDKTVPPAGTIKPDLEQLAAQAQQAAVENEWFDIPARKISMGIDDPDTADGPVRHFGWDVERPVREVEVKALKAKGRPITNGEYAQYLSATGTKTLPASWNSGGQSNGTNGFTDEASKFASFLHGKTVRTVYGSIALRLALDWPVSASYDELAGCAAYMGGRIPTVEEARSIYVYADGLKKRELSQKLENGIPAVNGHLVNDGVEESPGSKHAVNGSSSAAAGPDPNEVFVNLDKANVGFKHWHPMPVTPNGDRLAGQGDMGGLWEWTSSALEKLDGFEPMKLYPAYSADFYDDKHNIVLGGSWATHPRIAGRKTFVNWYQRNYLYAWAGARLVKDA